MPPHSHSDPARGVIRGEPNRVRNRRPSPGGRGRSALGETRGRGGRSKRIQESRSSEPSMKTGVMPVGNLSASQVRCRPPRGHGSPAAAEHAAVAVPVHAGFRRAVRGSAHHRDRQRATGTAPGLRGRPAEPPAGDQGAGQQHRRPDLPLGRPARPARHRAAARVRNDRTRRRGARRGHRRSAEQPATLHRRRHPGRGAAAAPAGGRGRTRVAGHHHRRPGTAAARHHAPHGSPARDAGTRRRERPRRRTRPAGRGHRHACTTPPSAGSRPARPCSGSC